MTLWLVGQNKGNSWDFQGIFDSIQKAINACRNENYWYTEIHVNECLVDETVNFDSVIHPKGLSSDS